MNIIKAEDFSKNFSLLRLIRTTSHFHVSYYHVATRASLGFGKEVPYGEMKKLTIILIK